MVLLMMMSSCAGGGQVMALTVMVPAMLVVVMVMVRSDCGLSVLWVVGVMVLDQMVGAQEGWSMT